MLIFLYSIYVRAFSLKKYHGTRYSAWDIRHEILKYIVTRFRKVGLIT